MDLLLPYLDEYIYTPYIYPSWVPEDNIIRQFLSLFLFVTLGGYLLVFIPDTIAYYYFYDHKLMKHKRFFPGQLREEIMYSARAIPVMTALTAFIFVFEVRGYGKLYTNVDDHPWGWWLIALSLPNFLFFTDFGIYWIHRWLHHPIFYGRFHKPHHKWVICTPFASHAFHPIDGFAQSLPYHIYPFIFPLNKYMYLALFVLVNIWTVSIHDGVYAVPDFLKPYINGSAHHTDHHADFHYNYGQYFTLWDRIGGSFKDPSGFHPGQSIHDQVDRQIRGEKEKEDPFYGIDPDDWESYAKEHNLPLPPQVNTVNKKTQ